MLANQDRTPLRITKFAWSNPKIENENIDGSLTIKGVCQRPISRIRIMNTPTFEITNNPVSDILTLKSENIEQGTILTIYSVEGIKVIESEFKENINIKELSTGMYFIRIGDKIEKFVKL